MAEDIRSLLEERAGVFDEIAKLRDNQDSWTEEQKVAWDARNEEFDSLSERISAAELELEKAARFEEISAKMDRDNFASKSEIGEARQVREIKEGRREATEEQRCLAMQGFLRYHAGRELSQRHVEAMELSGLRNKDGFDANVFNTSSRSGQGAWSTANGRGFLPTQQRADAQVGTDAEGGYLVPTGFQAELEKTMLAFGGWRGVCRIISTATGNDVHWPAADDTGNTGALLAEEGSIGSSVIPTFSEIVLKAYKYSSTPVKISAELLEDSAFNMAAEIGAMLGERIGRITATHFTTGDNSAKPQGITVGASAGVTAAATAAVTADELINLQDSLDPAYENGSTGWAMEKATVSAVRKLKDGNSQYLWQPGLQAGVPDLLLGRPVAVVQEMPSLAASAVTVLYGDFSKYIIRDVASARFYRLDELYRANDQTGFVLFSRHDGRVLQSAAIKKLTQAAV